MTKNSKKSTTNNSTTNTFVVKCMYITTHSVEIARIGGGR
ncbi:hypothetical protein SAMN05428976_11150 [Clostridium sp. USBA 49]|jgi:hypothetical protein|nr:hypothetical protein SAMN05428976_11150 [Clostridium sp. USBA 49]